MRRVWIAVAVAVALGASAIVATLVTTHTAGGPHILVYSESAGRNPMNDVVWRANVDGTHRVRLTKGSDPTISPDGRLVALVRDACASRSKGSTCRYRKLFVATASSGKIERVIDEKANSYAPTWALDSRHLALQPEFKHTIFVLDVKTGAKTLIASGRFVGFASFSPDSRFVVYLRSERSSSRPNLTSDLYVADLASGRSRRITHLGDAFAPVWGPQDIAFTHNQEVWLVDQKGNHLRRLVGREGALLSWWPALWSDGGRKLLLSAIYVGGGESFKVIDVPGDRVSFSGRGYLLGLSHDGKVALVDDCANYFGTKLGRVETVPLNGDKARVVVPTPKNGICPSASWTG